MRTRLSVLVGLNLALVLGGCANKEIVKPETQPQSSATPVPEATPEPKMERVVAPEIYSVLSGDSLWSIASKSSVLGDPFQWPLLYKKNRDQIADPDLIQIGQSLEFPVEADPAEIKEAIQKAEARAPYKRRASAVKY